MRKFFGVMTIGLVTMGFCGAGLAAEEIGTVAKKKFLGAVGYVGDDREDLYYDTSVYRDERVVCSKKAETTIRFNDRTKLQVGPNTEVILDEFVYDDSSGAGEIAVDLASGMFRFITGEIKTKENITLETPNVIVAVRGTDVIIAHVEGITQVSVLEGEVEVTPKGGA